MRRLTGSRVALAGHCLYFLRDDVPHEDIRHADAGTGSAFHEIAAASINGRKAALWALQNEDARALVNAATPHVQPGPGRRAEVAFAWDPRTGEARALGADIGREYEKHGAKPGDVCASADLVEVQGTTIRVIDWKLFANQGDPAKSAQLRTLAMMAASAYGAVAATIEYAYYGEGPEVRFATAHLDKWALTVTIPSELAALVEDAKPDVQPSPGPHCDDMHCPARVSCPAQRSRAEAAAPEHVRHLPILAGDAPLSDAAKARAVYDALCALDVLSKVWWQRLDEYADTVGPIDLGGGKAYRGWDEPRESIIIDDPAELALQEHFGAGYRGAIERSISKRAIEDLARAKDASRGLGKRVDAVLASLRNAGSTRTKTIRKHGVK